MAKKEKEGNGANTGGNAPARTGERQTAERHLPAPAGERAWRPTVWHEDPFRRLRDEMESLFSHFFGRWPGGRALEEFPARFRDVDVEETDNEITVRDAIPGFEPKDFDIHVSGNTLTIRAEHKGATEQKEHGSRSREWHYGRYERSIPLSTAVDPDKVQARYHSGVLELRLPRTEPSQRRRIEVKS
jgi:HSP20 family protein